MYQPLMGFCLTLSVQSVKLKDKTAGDVGFSWIKFIKINFWPVL